MLFNRLLSFCVISLVLNIVHLAPVEEKSLFDIISNDTLLKSNKIAKAECKRKNDFSDSLCLAIYDLSQQFQEAKLNFTESKSEDVDDICTALDKILPENPKIDLTSLGSSSKKVEWIKDILKQKEGKRCEEDCKFTDYDDDYEMKVKPACLFLFNQYQFLASQSTKQQEEKKSKSAEEIKSSDASVKSTTLENVKAAEEAAKAIVPILPANLVVEPPKTQNETQQVLEPPKVDAAPVIEVKKDEKPATTAAVVTSNKSETAQAKAETTKTESTVNAIDLDQQNSENSPDDQDVFNNPETQSDLPEKDFDINPDEGPDDYNIDGDDNTDMVRDNNHNMNNKFNPMSPDVDSADSERVRVEKVLDEFEDNPDSNFFTYLCVVMFLSILIYILYHNRHKILALLLEGRRGSRRPTRSRGGSKAAYSKLDCNLEEAITSKKSLSGKSMDIIY